MTLLKKSDIQTPVLPKETVDVPELGGEVVVCGLLLKDRLALFRHADAGSDNVSRMLASTVCDGDGLPVFSIEEWEMFGAKHFSACAMLFDVSSRLSGLNARVSEKN